MKTKFEQLTDQLFEKRIDENQMTRIIGGENGITSETFNTYITTNTDYQICGEDYRGRSCDPIVNR